MVERRALARSPRCTRPPARPPSCSTSRATGARIRPGLRADLVLVDGRPTTSPARRAGPRGPPRRRRGAPSVTSRDRELRVHERPPRSRPRDTLVAMVQSVHRAGPTPSPAALRGRDPRGAQGAHPAAASSTPRSSCCEDSSLVALSLRQVAKEVGIVPTAFYRHFDSIEDLGLALVEESFVSLREMLRDVRRSDPTYRNIIDSSVQGARRAHPPPARPLRVHRARTGGRATGGARGHPPPDRAGRAGARRRPRPAHRSRLTGRRRTCGCSRT